MGRQAVLCVQCIWVMPGELIGNSSSFPQPKRLYGQREFAGAQCVREAVVVDRVAEHLADNPPRPESWKTASYDDERSLAMP